MRRLLLLAAAAAVALSSCSDASPKLDRGIVVEKSYDDPDEWTTPGHWQPGVTICSGGYGSVPRSCSTTPGYYVPPVQHHDGPHWYLTITGRADGEWVTERHEVSEAKHDDTSVGREVDVS